MEELVIAHPDDLLEVEDRVVVVVQLLQGFGFVEVRLAQRGIRWGYLGLTQLLQCSVEARGFFLFGQLTESVEIFKGLVVDLHLQVEDASLHQTLLGAALIDFYRLREGLDRSLVIANPLQSISLAQEPETVIWRGDLNDKPEVR